TRPAHPAQASNGALPVGAILQLQHERLADRSLAGAVGLLRPIPGDKALLLEDVRDMCFQLAVRDRHGLVMRRVGFAPTCEHVCDRIGHGHGIEAAFPPWFPPESQVDLRRITGMYYQLDFVTPGSSPRWAISRRQIRHRPNF